MDVSLAPAVTRLSPTNARMPGAARRLSSAEFEPRDLNSALRIVFFAHPTQKNFMRSAQAIDRTPLPDGTRRALKNSIRGPLGIAREDHEPYVTLRSARLTSGQVAEERMALIDAMLARGATFAACPEPERGREGIPVEERSLSDTEKQDLARYKEVLAFFRRTTALDCTLSAAEIQDSLARTGFCVIHDNVMGDCHSQAVLLATAPQRVMFLNQLDTTVKPVDRAQQPVGGDRLQRNALYFAHTAEDFSRAQKTLVADYNARLPLFTLKVIEWYAEAAHERKHPRDLYNRQFTLPAIGYGCAFKTAADMEEVILGSDLKSRLQRHFEALASVAMQEKGLVPERAITEQEIWSSADFPHKPGDAERGAAGSARLPIPLLKLLKSWKGMPGE